jgi:CBS domain containing-hemolysin-like protein
MSRVPVTKIMVPRPLIQGLDADIQLRRVKRLKSSKVRIFPVYKGDLDRILGWIEKGKVLEILNEGREDARIENHLQPAPRIPDSAKVSDLADIFLKHKSPIAVVTDAFGKTAGLILITDFLKEFFGFDMYSTMNAPVETPAPLPKSYEI